MSFDPSKFKAIGESSNATFYEFDHEVLVVLPNEGSADTQASATQSVQIQLDYLRTRNRRSGVVVLMDNVMAQDAGARCVPRAARPLTSGVLRVGGRDGVRPRGVFALRQPEPAEEPDEGLRQLRRGGDVGARHGATQ